MNKNRSSVSNAGSYADIGAYWDEHDLAEQWSATEPAAFEVGSLESTVYGRLERTLAEQLRRVAEARGVSPETLLNLWVQQHVADNAP
jgi:hypothetical protein